MWQMGSTHALSLSDNPRVYYRMFLHVIRFLSPGGSPAPLAYDTSDARGPVYGCLKVVRLVVLLVPYSIWCDFKGR